MIASDFMCRLNVRQGQRVVIYGASGAIGTATVQPARHRGATVTGACSTTNLELVRSLGAASVIDHTKDDFTTSGPFDVTFDAVGRRKSAQAMANAAKALAAGGMKMSVDDEFRRSRVSDLVTLKQLAESGELRPVIDRTYLLEVDQGHKKGNVIVRIATLKTPN